MLHNKISKLIKITLVCGFFMFTSSGLFAQANTNPDSFLLEDGDRIEDVDPGYLEMVAIERTMLAEQQQADAERKSKKAPVSNVPAEGPKDVPAFKKDQEEVPSNDVNPNIH